ncbi:MAG: GFA family protein [Pikeienuella sp.]
MGVTFTGGCLCGRVAFTAAGPALNPHTCSCSKCQKHSGGLTVAWVEFPKGAVEWVGVPSSYRSSDYSCRAFCADCGSTLGALDDDGVVALVTGVFDDPGAEALRPLAHSFADRQPGWLVIDGDV